MKLYWYDKMIYGAIILVLCVLADKAITWFTKDVSGVKEVIPSIALVLIMVLILGHIVDLISRVMERERVKNGTKEKKKHA